MSESCGGGGRGCYGSKGEVLLRVVSDDKTSQEEEHGESVDWRDATYRQTKMMSLLSFKQHKPRIEYRMIRFRDLYLCDDGQSDLIEAPLDLEALQRPQ